MSYTLDFDERGDHAVATLGGVRTPEALVELAAAIIEYCCDHSVPLVLIDSRSSSGSLDTLETYEFAGHDIPRHMRPRQMVRAAILDRTENLDRVRFFETVANNRGLNLKVFDDQNEAEAWLHAGGTEDAD